MSLCVASALVAASFAGSAFTLSWTHSVERTEWRERWRITDGRALQLEEARVRGSGAGMEPPEGAVLRDGWWIYRPTLAAQPALLLAVSGATPDGWQLCIEGAACHDIEALAGGAQRIDRLRISAAADCVALPSDR